MLQTSVERYVFKKKQIKAVAALDLGNPKAWCWLLAFTSNRDLLPLGLTFDSCQHFLMSPQLTCKRVEQTTEINLKCAQTDLEGWNNAL